MWLFYSKHFLLEMKWIQVSRWSKLFKFYQNTVIKKQNRPWLFREPTATSFKYHTTDRWTDVNNSVHLSKAKLKKHSCMQYAILNKLSVYFEQCFKLTPL